MITKSSMRPVGVTALSIFFLLGSIICFIASLSLAFPNSFLEPMWRINPHGHRGLVTLGSWAMLLLSIVGVFCVAAAVGLWRGHRWGRRIAIALIAMNLVGDVINALLGTEPRAVIGIPIALALLLYLISKRVTRFFDLLADDDAGR
jgi:hypothetical protein